MKAKKKPLKALSPADLQVEIKSRLQTLKVTEPPKRQGGKIVASVDELLDKLRNEAKFLGKCNALSEALNKCLAQEFEVRRKQQLKEARARRAHYEAKWKQMDEEDRLHAEFEQAQQARKQQG
ncbi:putative electron transfer flavoprotein subunit [Coemansia sp. RSA 989]|nr:putative electron transfer flavoprotein subunit [Coemansia sp. RSA 989]